MNVCDEADLQEQQDQDLVTRFLQTREESVFRSLYRRHTPKLFLFCLRLSGGNHHTAEDLVQETWIRAVRNLAHFQWKSKFSSWLSGIALNCYREHRAKNLQDHPKVSELGMLQDSDFTLDLETLVRRLPDGCREVFLLHDLEGYTHSEIATALSISAGSSKSQLFEARKKLRQWLEPVRRKDK